MELDYFSMCGTNVLVIVVQWFSMCGTDEEIRINLYVYRFYLKTYKASSKAILKSTKSFLQNPCAIKIINYGNC